MYIFNNIFIIHESHIFSVRITVIHTKRFIRKYFDNADMGNDLNLLMRRRLAAWIAKADLNAEQHLFKSRLKSSTLFMEQLLLSFFKPTCAGIFCMEKQRKLHSIKQQQLFHALIFFGYGKME